MNMLERRSLIRQRLNVRGEGKSTVLVGYAAIFNSLSEEMRMKDGRKFREVIRPGAFAESLAEARDILALGEHKTILGRTGNGTLRVVEDQRGLRYEIDVPNTTYGRDLVESVRRGDIPGSSFGFETRSGGDSWRREGNTLVRELRSVIVYDVGPTAMPAYKSTDVALRSLEAWQEESPDATIPLSRRLDMRLKLAERS